MTAVPRAVDRQAAQIAEAAMRLPELLRILYAHHADRVRLGYPSSGSGRAGSDVSDPTAGAALDPARDAIDDYEQRVAATHSHLVALVDELDHLRKLAPDVAEASWKASRCSDPTCELVSVRAGRCWRHYRELLAERTEAETERVCVHCDGTGLKHRRAG